MTEQRFLTKGKKMDLFTIDGLQKLTGVESHNWHSYIVKELVDNSLDACEESNITPEIKVTVSGDFDLEYCKELIIGVEDNGPGITEENLKKILDANIYAGTKYYYARPNRGAQGNALMTVLPIPLIGKSGEGRVNIYSGEVFEISLVKDEIHQDYYYQLTKREGSYNGTSVELIIVGPQEKWVKPDKYVRLFRAFSTFNPHARFEFNVFGETYVAEPKGEIGKYSKKGEPVHWYSKEDLKNLILAYIRSGHDINIKDFCVERFYGFTRNKSIDIKRGAKLSSMAENGDIPYLHSQLKEITGSLKPNNLGKLGKEQLKEIISEYADSERLDNEFKYKSISESLERNGKEIPIVIEAASAPRENGEGLLSLLGINFSPAHNPRILNDSLFMRYDLSRSDDLAVILHISCPNLEYSNYGKTEFNLNHFRGYWYEALNSILKDFIKEKRKKEREEENEENRRRKAQEEAKKREKRQKKRQIKEAFLSTLDEALRFTSDNGKYVPTVRQLFYKHRPMLQDKGFNIEYNYYSDRLEKEEERRGVRLANREARGVIIHPRSSEWINIDTKTVNNYDPPEWEFNKVLYIEKRGFLDYLIQERIHSRYDMVLMGGQGQSTWDNRALLAKIVSQVDDCTIFCLHDADIDGISIKHNLEKEHYLEGTSVQVVDMGLSPSEAIEKDLPKETQERNKKPKKIKKLVSGEELEFFNIRRSRNGKWLVDRVELNVFSPGEFVRWVEDKLEEYGVTEKVLPPDEVIEDKVTEKVELKEEESTSISVDDSELKIKFNELKSFVYDNENLKGYRFREYLEERFFDFFEIETEEVREELEEKLRDNPPESWADLLEDYVNKDLSQKDRDWRKHIEDIEEEFTNKARLEEMKKVLSQHIRKYENEENGLMSGWL